MAVAALGRHQRRNAGHRVGKQPKSKPEIRETGYTYDSLSPYRAPFSTLFPYPHSHFRVSSSAAARHKFWKCASNKDPEQTEPKFSSKNMPHSGDYIGAGSFVMAQSVR